MACQRLLSGVVVQGLPCKPVSTRASCLDLVDGCQLQIFFGAPVLLKILVAGRYKMFVGNSPKAFCDTCWCPKEYHTLSSDGVCQNSDCNLYNYGQGICKEFVEASN